MILHKPIYPFIAALIIVSTSCGSGENTKTSNSWNDSTNLLTLGDTKFNIQPISQTEFETGYKPAKEFDEAELLPSSKNVHRQNDSLIFDLLSGKQYVLADDSSFEETRVIYHYSGEIMGTGQWTVFALCYEWYNYIFVNQQTGDTTVAIGNGVVSPDHKLILCGNADLLAEFTFNGLELYELTGNKMKRKGRIELTDWGPSEMYWKDDKTVYIRQTRINENTEEYSTYCKLVMTD